MDEKTKRKISISMKGKNIWAKGRKSDRKGKTYKQIFGIERADEMKNKLSISHKGQKPWNYIDGRSKLLGPARYGDDWDKVRYWVYCRDHFTCQDCGKKGGDLEAHHCKKSFSKLFQEVKPLTYYKLEAFRIFTACHQHLCEQASVYSMLLLL